MESETTPATHSTTSPSVGLIDLGPVRGVLQPVIRLLDRVIVGYEALSRGSPVQIRQTPDELFDQAAAGEMDAELDLACARAALACAAYTSPATLLLNVSTATLLEPEPTRRLLRLASDAAVPAPHIVLTLTEGVPIPDLAGLRAIIGDLRTDGFRICIKEAGARHTSMWLIAEVRPDFIQVAPDLVRDVHSSESRRALVVSLLSLGTHINARVIAEGIETEQDLKTLFDLGVQFGQGRYLGDPVLLGSLAGDEAPAVDPVWFHGRSVECFPSGVPLTRSTYVPGQSQPAAKASKRAHLPHALSNAALALQAEHDPQRILAVIAEQLSLVVPVDDLSIYEADHANHQFVAAYATGPQVAQIVADVFSMSTGLNGWAFALGTPQNLANAGAHPAAMIIPNTPFEHESLLLIPLVAGDHKLGMLNCRRMGLNKFTDEDLEAATLFGHTAAAAWHNAQLYQELARRAMTDGLTGLFNSRWLREAGEREIADCRRRGAALSIVLVDLDHFKKINDSGGHAAGDIVLQRVADELHRTTRAGDAAVRLGGEEFILILRDSDAAGAFRVAIDLRRAMTKVPMPPECSGIEQITASMGIASFPEHGSSLTDLVRAADVAMYIAKREGRDRVRLAVGAASPLDGSGSAVA